MTTYIVHADQSDNGKEELDLLHEMHYIDVLRTLETAADRSVVGLFKQQVFGLRGLHGSNIITVGPARNITSH